MTPPHVKRAATGHPVLDPIAARWSPYVFAPRQVEHDKLAMCLEAARWAASSYNEQPQAPGRGPSLGLRARRYPLDYPDGP